MLPSYGQSETLHNNCVLERIFYRRSAMPFTPIVKENYFCRRGTNVTFCTFSFGIEKKCKYTF